MADLFATDRCTIGDGHLRQEAAANHYLAVDGAARQTGRSMVSDALRELLAAVVAAQGSELLLYGDTVPHAQIHGHLKPLDAPPVAEERVRDLSLGLLSDEERQRLKEEGRIRTAFDVVGLARFRADVFMPKGNVVSAFRPIPLQCPTLEQLGLPREVTRLAEPPHGLVLVTGPRGSGRSTTVAAVLDRISVLRETHAVDLEDPVEHLHPSKKPCPESLRTPSETATWVRENLASEAGCVVLLGEIAAPRAAILGLCLAEAGYLVLATLPARSVVDALDRVLGGFSGSVREVVQERMARAVYGILNQRLLPAVDRDQRVVAVELLVTHAGISGVLAAGETEAIAQAMRAVGDETGMVTLNESLLRHYFAKRITIQTALNSSDMPDELMDTVMSHRKATTRKPNATVVGRSLWLDDTRGRWSFKVDEGVVRVLGRRDPADLVIPHLTVARRHARVWCANGDWLVEDVKSPGGVRLNGKNVGGPTRLADGDELQLGQVSLRVRIVGA